MKVLVMACSFFFLATFTTKAQTSGTANDMAEDRFSLTLSIDNSGALRLISLYSSKGESLRAEITDAGALTRLGLEAGAVIEGIFTFSRFASDGGLGTTRVQGEGEIRLTRVSSRNGKPLSCPVDSAWIGLAIR